VRGFLARHELPASTVDLAIFSQSPVGFTDGLAARMGLGQERVARVARELRGAHTASPIAALDAAIESGQFAAAATILFATVGAAVVAGAIAVVAVAASSAGSPPPEYAEDASSWPAHNYDLSNSRSTTATEINASNVSKLHPIWRFRIPGSGAFGNFASTPIVQGGVVYLQDLNSNVYALNRATGKVKWAHKFNKPSEGPNGIAFGYGRVANRKRGRQIVVNDGDYTLSITDGGVGGVAQVHEKRFVRFIERVAIDRDDDALARLTGGEGN